MKSLRSKKGFTLVEIVVVLGVIAVLSAILIPVTINYLSNARIRRAEADVKIIGQAIIKFNGDLREWPIWATGTVTKPADTKYDVLSSESGDDAATDGTAVFDTTTNLDSIDDQLITNTPGYPTSITATLKRIWEGPYIERLTEDPWGNKYYVTVKYLQPSFLSPGSGKAVFILSAGPNEQINTNFEQAPGSFTVGGDDIAFLIK